MARIHRRTLETEITNGKKAVELQKQGVSLNQIAERYQVSVNSILKWRAHYKRSLKS